MIDIVSSAPGADLQVMDTDVPRGANILATQLGSLEYAPALGIDLAYFLTERIKFQDESFKSYLVRTLAEEGINVVELIEEIENLFSRYTITLAPVEQTDALIAR